jgi:cytochrome c oxidase assembly protein subunit 19
MAPDNFQNLGLIFKDDEGKDQTSAASAAPAANANQTGNKS